MQKVLNVPTQLHPQEFDRALAEKVLDRVQHVHALGERIRIISGQFLGAPYVVNPLTGSADAPEAFTISLAGFDCVTYIETVLALAMSGSVDQFVDTLRQIRYNDGRVDWGSRTHYMTDWIRNNARRGFVKNITCGGNTVSKTRTLSTLEGLPPKVVTFKCFPKRLFRRIENRITDGDLIFFASTRTRLDVFHTGLLFRQGEQIALRHAARSQEGVVEQPLVEFLKTNRMAGLILVRPRKKSLAEE